MSPTDGNVVPGLRDGPLVQLLSGLDRDEPIHYLPQPGNGGDALINVGFFDLARSLGLKYTISNRQAALGRGDTLIMAGGAGLTTGATVVPDVLARYSQQVGTLIVLPQTVQGHDDLLRGLGENVTLFVRERISYEHAQAASSGAHVILEHDMAFHSDATALTTRRSLRGLTVSPRRLRQLARLTRVRRRSRSSKRLDTFRTDRGASGRFVAPAGLDISKLSTFGVRTEEECYFSASQLARTVDAFEEIHSDRLHVAIVSARLGKRTVLYDNRYWKCRAVFEHSLHYYPNVEMAGPEALPHAEPKE